MQVKTLKSGEIDYDHFRELLISNRSRPAIVNVNCGTTVKGAVDDLDRVLEILRDCGYSEDRFYIHVDGALFGMMVSMHDLASKLKVQGHRLRLGYLGSPRVGDGPPHTGPQQPAVCT